MLCPKCGKEAPGSSTFCPSCGSRLAEAEEIKKTRYSIVAGSLDLVSGCISLVGLFGIIIAIVALASDPFRHDPQEVDPLVIVSIIAGLLAILSVLAILGGINALGRKRFGMALAGAVAATLTFFPIGIPAIVLTALSRDEFE
jgi:hypothetical protein